SRFIRSVAKSRIRAASAASAQLFQGGTILLHRFRDARRHLGCRFGERSRPFIWAAASACLARPIKRSLAVPCGSTSAACLERSASSTNRCSSVFVCLKRRRLIMALLLFARQQLASQRREEARMSGCAELTLL